MARLYALLWNYATAAKRKTPLTATLAIFLVCSQITALADFDVRDPVYAL